MSANSKSICLLPVEYIRTFSFQHSTIMGALGMILMPLSGHKQLFLLRRFVHQRSSSKKLLSCFPMFLATSLDWWGRISDYWRRWLDHYTYLRQSWGLVRSNSYWFSWHFAPYPSLININRYLCIEWPFDKHTTRMLHCKCSHILCIARSQGWGQHREDDWNVGGSGKPEWETCLTWATLQQDPNGWRMSHFTKWWGYSYGIPWGVKLPAAKEDTHWCSALESEENLNLNVLKWLQCWST